MNNENFNRNSFWDPVRLLDSDSICISWKEEEMKKPEQVLAELIGESDEGIRLAKMLPMHLNINVCIKAMEAYANQSRWISVDEIEKWVKSEINKPYFSYNLLKYLKQYKIDLKQPLPNKPTATKKEEA